jgi:hypothetical protein
MVYGKDFTVSILLIGVLGKKIKRDIARRQRRSLKRKAQKK